MVEIFTLYGNPYSRKNWKKNLIQSLFTKYYKRVTFTDYNNISNINTYSSININPLKISSLCLNSSHTEIVIHNKNQSMTSNIHLKKLNTMSKYSNNDDNKNIEMNIKQLISENQSDLNQNIINDESSLIIINKKKSSKTETTTLNHLIKKNL
jgi:hypothetical protein